MPQQVRIQMVAMELVDGVGMPAGDMRPAQMFGRREGVLYLVTLET
jgi:hypothetical protein